MRARHGARWWPAPLLLLVCASGVLGATCSSAAPYTLPAADSFTLLSDNYTTGGPLPRNERCVWVLTLLTAGRVHAVTVDAGLELQISIDYVKIYDGASVGAPLLAGLRRSLRNHQNATVYSTGSSITVEYMSGGLIEGTVRGFGIVSAAVSPAVSATVAGLNVSRALVAVRHRAGVARGPYNESTPSSGIAYPRNIVSTLIITSPPGTVVRLAFGNMSIADGDSLIIYDNDTRGSVLDVFAGKPTVPMLEIFSSAVQGAEAASVGGRVVVEFRSSGRHKFSVAEGAFMSGFEFDYMAWDPVSTTLCGRNVTDITLNATGVLRLPQPSIDAVADPESGPDRSFVAHTLPPGAICRFRLQVPTGSAMLLNSVSTGADFRVWNGPDRNAPIVPPIPRVSRPFLVPVGVYGVSFYLQVNSGPRDQLAIDYSIVSVPRCELAALPTFTTPSSTVQLSYGGLYPTRTPNVTCTAQIQTAAGTVIRISDVTLDGDDYLDVYEITGGSTSTFYARVTSSMLPIGALYINGSHVRLVFVAGGGAARGLSLEYEAIAPPAPQPRHVTIAAQTGVTTTIAASSNGSLLTPGTYVWNITGDPGNQIWFTSRSVSLGASEHVWIYDGVDTAGEVMGHYTDVKAFYTDLYSASSNVVVVLIIPASVIVAESLLQRFSFDFEQTSSAPFVPDYAYPSTVNMLVAPGECQIITFPANLPLGRRYTINLTIAADASLDLGFVLLWYGADPAYDEVTDIYQLDGTSLAWRWDSTTSARFGAAIWPVSCPGPIYTYGRTIIFSIWTGDYGQRCVRCFTATADDDVINEVIASTSTPVCSGTTFGSGNSYQESYIVPTPLAYWQGMHCEWLLTPDAGKIVVAELILGAGFETPGADLTFTNMATNETIHLRDQIGLHSLACSAFIAATANSSLLITWHVYNVSHTLPQSVRCFRDLSVPATEFTLWEDPISVLTGHAGGVVSVSWTPPTELGLDSMPVIPWHTPFEHAYHLSGRRDSSWTAVYGNADINQYSTSINDDRTLPRVRVYNGSDTTAPLLYDSLTDRLPFDDTLGTRIIPAGLSTGPDAYVVISMDTLNMPLSPFHGRLWRNSIATPACVDLNIADPGPYDFAVGTQNTPGGGCKVTSPPPRGLNMYSMTVVDGSSLQAGEFVSVYTDGTLAARYGHARDPLTTTEVGARFNTSVFWLPTVTAGIRIVFEAMPIDAAGISVAPLSTGRFPFTLRFKTAVRSDPVSGGLIAWSLYGPPSDIRMCGDNSILGAGVDFLYSQADAVKWNECDWISRLRIGDWGYIAPSDYFQGALFMPNVTWMGELRWWGAPNGTLPNLEYIDNCLAAVQIGSDIQMGKLVGIGNIFTYCGILHVPGLRRLATLSIPSLLTSVSFPDLEYLAYLSIPLGSSLTTLTLGNNTKFGSIYIPAGLPFSMVFPYNLEVETSVDMTNVRVLGNLTLTSRSASVCLTSSYGMPWIKMPNATVADVSLNGCPNVSTVYAPQATKLSQLQLINVPVSQVIMPSLTDVGVTNVVLEDLPNLSLLPNMTTASVNVVSVSIKRTSLTRWETLNTQRMDSFTMIDNPEVESLRVCGAIVNTVSISNAPLLSCDAINVSLSGYLVPSYSVTGCGAFPSTVQPCILPPPVPQPPATPGCLDPGQSSNGDRYLDAGNYTYDSAQNVTVFTTGAELSFACEDGYRLLGHVSITCRVSGRWSGAAPTCEVDTGALVQPTLGDFTPTLIPLRTSFNLTLVAGQVNLPLRSIDTHDGDLRTGDDQWTIDPNGGSARRRRRLLAAGTHQISFTVAPRVEASYLTVTVEDGYGLRATDDTSVYFTDDCPTPGTFGIGLDCHPCPDGGYCPGGNRVWPLPGYWNEGESSGHVLVCPEATACLGGRFSSCAVGYHGPLCAACDAHYYLRGTECAVCPPKQEETAIYIAAAIFFPLLALAFCTLPDMALDVVIIVLKVLQLVRAGSTQGGARLPEGFKQFTFYLSLVTFDFEFIKPTCSFLEGYPYFYTLFWGNAVIAAMLVVPSFVLLSVLRIAHKSRREFYVNRTYRAVTIQLSLLYYVVAVRTMQSVTCVKIGEGRRLLADPTIPCADNYTVQIAGGLGLAAFTSGVPIAAAYLVNRLARKGIWRNKRVEARYGFLYSDLNMGGRRHFYVVLPYLQLMCASIAWTVLKVGVAPYILNILALVILLMTSIVVQPFARGIGNAIAVLSYGLGLAAVVIGLCSLGETPVTLVIGWSLGGIIVLFALVVTSFFIFKDIRHMRLRKTAIEPLKDASGMDSLSSVKYLESSMMTTPILESTFTSSIDELTSTKLISPSVSLALAADGDRTNNSTPASLMTTIAGNNTGASGGGLAAMAQLRSGTATVLDSSGATSPEQRRTPVYTMDESEHPLAPAVPEPVEFKYFPRETSSVAPEAPKPRPPSP